MIRATRGLLVLAALCTFAACGGAARGAGVEGAGTARSRADWITLDEIRERGQYSNLYDMIQVLRPRWLRAQGPDTLLGQPGEVQVVLDGNRMGSVASLRRLAVAGVTSIRWVGPIEAAAQFGLNHGHGAIVISTAPVH